MSWESSLLAILDELRQSILLLQNDCTEEFLTFVTHQEQCRQKWQESVLECQRLKTDLDLRNVRLRDYEKKLNRARCLLDSEKRKRIKAERERDELQEQVTQIEEILSSVRHAGDKLANETKEKLDKFLNTTYSKLKTNTNVLGYHLDTIDEINSSLLSDLSYTKSDDFVECDTGSDRGIPKKPLRSTSPDINEFQINKRRKSSWAQNKIKKIEKISSDQVIARTTLTLSKQGPIIASSTIETFPDDFPQDTKPSAPPKLSSDTDSDVTEAINCFHHNSSPIYSKNKLFNRPHSFRNKTNLKPTEECGVCIKKIMFGNKMFYCSDCKVMVHPECKDKAPMPCLAVVATPRGTSGTTIADFCSRTPPMVPPLIVHCVFEVEARGLGEVGIYRIPGSEKDVRALKDRFLRGKGICSLSGYDIHVVCGTIKDFLRSLGEPLVTFSLWPEFIRASENEDVSERTSALYQAVSQLPQPNRDTLAFMMQHLQKVSQSPDCKMSKSNLAKVFGPTIVGYSRIEPVRNEMYVETAQQTQVIECLLDMPGEYWYNFVNNEPDENIQPSTPVLSLNYRRLNRNKNRKVFNTPPVTK
ncbi:Rac GTPase-activating protein, putative [Pediculus humanus corporis]|uniref:Rac GTPase-activating protein, putative n=1 Tax=Pediculus humanus subsp. corporis TaxID=121224 RepID=E0W417_PEDHC|nr:Rac GTPase-activating protein, putative [Pediculus humanus corporis]EEB20373.1 Rac GTPase-activating protein, putative [Pediculus humanus corporis]